MEFILLGVSLVAAVFGYLIKNQIQAAQKRVDSLETFNQQHAKQQARDDVRWENQVIVNNKVDLNQNDTAVLKSQVSSLHNSVDELKKDIKEVNNKLDVLIQRK